MASARDWILVLFGRFIRERYGWISSRHLVELLEPLGADAASTRTAISRMKRSGFVESRERDGLAGYQLTDAGERFFADGDQRVLARAPGDGRWVLASFSVPESKRSIRYRVRARLLDLGFGQESSGLLIAPSGLCGEAERALRRERLDEWVSLWVADFGALGSITEVVERSWDLEALRARYASYIQASMASLERGASDQQEAFALYVQRINDWRELSYLDPGLPALALPVDWPGPVAQELFETVERRLRPAADAHFDKTVSQVPMVVL